jgi:hypothetical protein
MCRCVPARLACVALAAVLALAACDYEATPGPLGAEEIIGRLSMGDTVTVTVGDTVTLIPRIYDIRGTQLDRYRLPNGQVLVWSTSNANIATVADGLVRGSARAVR